MPQFADRPALIVWGRRDFAFGEADAARFGRLFPRSRTIFFDDASHFLQEDVGDRIADAYKEFRRELSAAESAGKRAADSHRHPVLASRMWFRDQPGI